MSPKIYDKETLDELVDSWFLMGSPLPVIFILAFYAYFVYKLGPRYMEKKQAYKLKYVLIIYNLVQVIFNTYICTEFYRRDVLTYIWNYSCRHLVLNPLTINFYSGAWYYTMSKFMDLFDTVRVTQPKIPLQADC